MGYPSYSVKMASREVNGRLLGLVISTSHRNWAIGSLADTLRSQIPETGLISMPQSRRDARSLKGLVYLPKYRNYLFMHHALAVEAWGKGWINERSNFGVRFTHEGIDITNESEVFRAAKFVTVERSESRYGLIDLGVEPGKISMLPHPIDVGLFQGVSQNVDRDIIFVSNYADRKNPDLILETIKQNPDLSFTIFGKNWEIWYRYPELISLQNLVYLPFEYKTYSHVLARHKVFCSLSYIEGGPVPLLESLVTGLKVVVTDTGYVRDVLQMATDYNILPINPNIVEIRMSLQSALSDLQVTNSDYREYSIENYVSKIRNMFGL